VERRPLTGRNGVRWLSIRSSPTGIEPTDLVVVVVVVVVVDDDDDDGKRTDLRLLRSATLVTDPTI